MAHQELEKVVTGESVGHLVVPKPWTLKEKQEKDS